MSCDAMSLCVEKGAATEYEYANNAARCDEIRQMCLSIAYDLCNYIIVLFVHVLLEFSNISLVQVVTK